MNLFIFLKNKAQIQLLAAAASTDKEGLNNQKTKPIRSVPMCKRKEQL
jgi:hypothetical protein